MQLAQTVDLGESYQRYFQVVPALTESLKDQVYRIRHQVYCEDLAFEPLRPDKRESDDYDKHSLHLLIRSVQSSDFVGCTRLVLVPPTDRELPLPFERACAATLDRSLIDPARLPRETIAEVSRLAVVSQYRRRRDDNRTSPVSITDADFGTPAQPRFPYIPIALYLGTIELARLNNVRTLFMLTERRLAVHFKKLGVNIHPIGAPVEYRGERIPSMLDAMETITNMRAMARPLYRVIATEIANGYRS